MTLTSPMMTVALTTTLGAVCPTGASRTMTLLSPITAIPTQLHVHAVGNIDLDVAHDGGGGDVDVAPRHLGTAQVEHHVPHDGDRRERPLDPPSSLPLAVAHDGDDPLAVGTGVRSPRGSRGAGPRGQVGGDGDQVATGGSRVGGLGPFGQLAEREPAFDGGHPQSLHDRSRSASEAPTSPDGLRWPGSSVMA